MRLLYITSSLPYGPTETFVITEVEELIAHGHEVYLVPLHPRGVPVHKGAIALLPNTITQPVLSPEIFGGMLKQFIRSPRGALQALELGFSLKPRLFIKNLSVFAKALWVARLAQKLKVDHIHAHWASTTSSMAMMASRVSGIPWSFTAHRWDIVENNLLDRKINCAQFARFIAKRGVELAELKGVVAVGRTVVLHMGVQLPKQLAKQPQSRSIFRLLCPASLTEVKGHRYLFEAMTLLSDLPIELWLAGEGILRKQLEKLAQSLNLDDKVRFLGALPHDQLLRLYDNGEVDVVVLASVDLGDGLPEGIPVSLMEAMAYEVPVISTSGGGTPELIVNGTGLLVDQKKPVELAKAIRTLYNSPELRSQLAQAGRKQVLQSFEIGVVVENLIRLFMSGNVNSVGEVK